MERKQKRTKGNNSTRNNERENENGEVGKDNLEDEDVKRRCITAKSSAFSSSMFQKCLMQMWNYIVDFLALLNSCNRFPDSLN